MAVFQFVGLSPCRTGQQLITQTDAHTRTDSLIFQEHADMLHRLAALLGVAWAISQKQAVKLQLVKIVVPRHTNHLKAATYQTTDDVGLHAAVHQHHALPSTFVIGNDLLARHLLHPVHASVILLSRKLRHRRSPLHLNLPHHYAMLTEHLRQSASVDTSNGRHLFSSQPSRQRFFCIPMREAFAIVCHHQGFDMNALTLQNRKSRTPARGVSDEAWHPIITYQRIGHHQYLPCIAGVSQTFRVAHHCRVEHHLANGRCRGLAIAGIAERPATEHSSVFEYQFCFSHDS